MVGRSPNLALRLASATRPLKPARSCSFAADTFARPCSSVCSTDAMDHGSGARRRETPRLPVQDGCWTRWTSGAFVDVGRLTHNPEVAGSNPAPATRQNGSGDIASGAVFATCDQILVTNTGSISG